MRCQGTNADGEPISAHVSSTLGRFLFNEILPQDLGYVDRTVPGNELLPEVDFLVAKKQLKQILEKSHQYAWRDQDCGSAGFHQVHGL